MLPVIIHAAFLLGFGSIFLVGALIYSQNRAGYLQKMFLWCTVAVAYRTLCEWGIRFSPTREEAVLWANVSFLRPMALALLLHFILYYTGYWRKIGWYIAYPITYAPAVVFSFTFLLYYDKYAGLVNTEYGWVFRNYFPSLIFQVNLFWAIAVGSAFLTVWWAYYARSNPLEKKKKLAFSLVLTFLIVATIVIILLKLFQVIDLFPLNGIMIVMIFMVTGILAWRYQIIASPSQIMEEIIVAMNEGLVLLSGNAEILKVNKALSALTGYGENELSGKPANLIFPQNLLPMLFQHCISGKPDTIKRFETVLSAKNNQPIPVEISVAVISDKSSIPLAIVIFCNDLAHKRKIEIELQKAQKLDTYELMAKGILHDFNNLLGIISMQVSLSNINESLPQAIKQDLTTVTNAAKLASQLAMQFGQYLKESSTVKKMCSMSSIIGEAAAIAKCGKKLEIAMENLDDLPAVEVNYQQLMQVFINLFINAGHAMNDQGVISVKGNIASCGSAVVLTVQDYGHGIGKDILPHIFEPFFTTKTNGKGLGLVVVEKIVKNHKGTISVSSTDGAGATFAITLPVSANISESDSGFLIAKDTSADRN
jgi:PAS domain S-box-containing protein